MTAVIFKATHVCTACHVNFKCFRIEENDTKFINFVANENLLSILKLCFPGIPMDINEIRNPTFCCMK